jgi:hypothetical protein
MRELLPPKKPIRPGVSVIAAAVGLVVIIVSVPVAVVIPTVVVAAAWRRGSTVTRPCLTVIDDQAWTTMANDAGSELLVQLWQLAQQQQRR